MNDEQKYLDQIEDEFFKHQIVIVYMDIMSLKQV